MPSALAPQDFASGLYAVTFMRIVATGRIGRPSYIRIFDVDASVVIGMSTTELATALVAGSGLGKLPASFTRANSDKSEY